MKVKLFLLTILLAIKSFAVIIEPSQSWPNQSWPVDTAIDLDYAIEPQRSRATV